MMVLIQTSLSSTRRILSQSSRSKFIFENGKRTRKVDTSCSAISTLCTLVLNTSTMSFFQNKLFGLLIQVITDHPLNTKFIGAHAKVGAPKLFGQRNHHLTSGR